MSVQDYINLITPEHRFQPKYVAWVSTSLGMVNDLQNLFSSMNAAFDIDSAIGNQLDTIGQLLNVSRSLPYQPQVSTDSNPVFAWGDTGNGYGGWGTGYWLLSGVSPVLDDNYYRLILKASIVRDRWDGTTHSLILLLNQVFSKSGLIFLLQDSQDMTFTVIAYGTTDPLTIDMLKHEVMIPRPEGVQMNVVVSDAKLFAWGVSNEVYGGWGDGTWVGNGVQ